MGTATSRALAVFREMGVEPILESKAKLSVGSGMTLSFLTYRSADGWHSFATEP